MADDTMVPGITRIELIEMQDPWPIPPGTQGTLDFIDDAGQLHMTWDNGRTLALIPEADRYKIIGPDVSAKPKL